MEPRTRNSKPMQITDAEPSRNEQIHKREVRYVTMMLIRAGCLIVATVLVINHVPLLALWIPVLLFGMIAIPWLAVILANDRAPKEQYRIFGKVKHRPPTPPTRLALPSSHQRTIDISQDEKKP